MNQCTVAICIAVRTTEVEKGPMQPLRADDYDEKIRAILDAAAALFAKTGYLVTKMEDIAKACGAKKSMLYHYFPTKDDLLFAMLDEHMDRVLAVVEHITAGPGSAEQRFSAFVQAYTQKSAQSRRRHVVALNDVRFLPRKLQNSLRKRETRLTDAVAEMLRELAPGLPDEVYKPYTMLLIGILNWTDLWYKPAGKVKPKELCERTSRLFLHGFLIENRRAEYETLTQFLHDVPKNQPSITLSFRQIEQILNDRLPDGAFDSPEWWEHQKGVPSRHYARAWKSSGFEVEAVHQFRQDAWVRFRRIC